ncbi:Ada metal-binding domain-containing protein [Hydrogenophaga sp.]|uniref:Ada metal-binding domain-containing protein n=1 Tax=Hydrogenophaga sp. TaxID=1904254 RepID=UPI00263413A0|nr:Ada metal-binding domain-containing protein [Hydrogenophaga sp.]MCW5653773.1 helix-turn-helix domain-containing protein [Hydrogenophaga sp.]
MSRAPSPIDDDACYRALCSHDARFDGRFFTAVTSTGIYCRPVCRVRTPRRENCRFFEHAAQAERAGFRPCLRCRPELAPLERHWSTEDASAILVQQATQWLDDPRHWQDGDGVRAMGERLSERLGVSDRHLRRVFEEHLGVSPLQYLQTRKLLTAKQLLADTDLPVTQVALASGFASVRRFNAAFLDHYRLNPTQLRQDNPKGQQAAAGQGTTTVRLGYRPPYDVAATLAFFRQRLIDGVAFVAHDRQLGHTLRLQAGPRVHTGWLLAEFEPARNQVLLRVSDSLREVLPQVIHRLRATLDLDADPVAINTALHGSFPHGDGLRVPGALDGFELAVRAVLGQQVTVAAARTFAQRLVGRFGEAVDTPFDGLTRLFPTPQVLAQAEGDALGELGIVRQRQAAIVALARAVADGGLALHGSADVPATLAALQALPGIGDWTAQYIAMRALRWPDAFPAGDVALHKSLGVQGMRQPARAAEAASQAWRPWRSYAVVRAWAAGTLSTPTGSTP